MPVPTLSVQIGLDPNSFGNSYFVVGADTDTPTSQPRAVLDNTTFTLGGTFFTEISSYVKQLTITRGRSRELDRYQTGTANISFKNQDRTFDPSNTASTLYPNIVPRREIRITSGGSAIFTGLVDDWDLAYDVSGQSDAYAKCVDGFAVLSKQALTAFTATSQPSGSRIGTVLSRSEVAWPESSRAIDTGQQTLQADVVAQDTNVLQYLQLVEASEPGSFFISAAGSATFKDRNTAMTVGTVTLADDGSGIPYVEATVRYGTELLYNRINLTRAGGSVQVASNAASQAQYGINTYEDQGLLIDTDANTLSLASYLLAQYQQAELRFDEITVELSALTAAQQAQVLARDLTNVVTVKFTPNRTGSQISQYCEILGITHQISPASHRVTFKLGSTFGVAFVLDSSTYGILDTSTLGF